MNTERLVTSFDLSRRLAKRGYPQEESIFIWRKYSLSDKARLYLRPPEGTDLAVIYVFRSTMKTATRIGIKCWATLLAPRIAEKKPRLKPAAKCTPT